MHAKGTISLSILFLKRAMFLTSSEAIFPEISVKFTAEFA
jgi:hypothetical protein